MKQDHNSPANKVDPTTSRHQSKQQQLLAYPKRKQYHGSHPGVLNCCVAYNRYGGYCVPLSVLPRPAVQLVLAGEVYEPDTIAFMREHCGTGDMVHAGTFFGDFLPGISQACAPDAKIWAFEPNPESYRCAKATLEINGVSNVELSNAGLGSSKGDLFFQVADDQGVSLGGHSRFLGSGQGPKAGCVEVSVVRIDDVVPVSRNVRILQLDVEGFEEQALRGAIETIRRCLPILILETEVSQDWLKELLPGIEYRHIRKLHRNTVLAANELSPSTANRVLPSV